MSQTARKSASATSRKYPQLIAALGVFFTAAPAFAYSGQALAMYFANYILGPLALLCSLIAAGGYFAENDKVLGRALRICLMAGFMFAAIRGGDAIVAAMQSF